MSDDKLSFLKFNGYFIVHLFSSNVLCSFCSYNNQRGALVICYWIEYQELLEFNLKVSEEQIYNFLAGFFVASSVNRTQETTK